MRVAISVPAVAAACVFGMSATADVIREGAGTRRAELDAMELKPFPVDAWGTLSDWTGGAALNGAATSGRPVLICTWASWYPKSLTEGLGTAQRMADRFGGDGLVVVGIHHPQGWDEAAAAAAKAGAKFLIARDAAGDFRNRLKVDQDPDFYVIDRAGHLRFADITSGSVEEAVQTVIAETPQEAADYPRKLKEEEERARAERMRSEAIRQNIELDTLPPVPPGYELPGEDAYRLAPWPKLPEEYGKSIGLLDQSGNRVDVKLAITPAQWTPTPPTFEGRAVVVYLWNPELRESYTVFNMMDQVQQKYIRDLVVIGAYTPLSTLSNTAPGFGATPPDEEQLAARLLSFVRSRNFKHTLAADFGGSAAGSVPQGPTREIRHPRCIIASSDGTIRWIGTATDPSFDSWLTAVLRADPGVRARQQADRLFIENRKR